MGKGERLYRYVRKGLTYIQLFMKTQKINLKDQAWNKKNCKEPGWSSSLVQATVVILLHAPTGGLDY